MVAKDEFDRIENTNKINFIELQLMDKICCYLRFNQLSVNI